MVPVWDNGLHSVQDVGIRGRWLSTIADWVVEKCSAPPGITLCVEGNIGAGKSTYLDMVMEGSKSDCSRVHEMVEVVPEPVEMWQNVNGGNLLELFYENPKRYAFTFQQYVFVTRMQTVRPRRSNPGSHRFGPETWLAPHCAVAVLFGYLRGQHVRRVRGFFSCAVRQIVHNLGSATHRRVAWRRSVRVLLSDDF